MPSQASGNPTAPPDSLAGILQRVLNAQRAMIEMVATGAPLPDILNSIAGVIEQQSTGDLCTILRLTPDGLHLRVAAGGSLPAEYNAAIDGCAIGPSVGSCGTAAFAARRVIAEDLLTDPRWADYKHLALAHGLAACWSQPILSRDGARVLGTVANYSRKTGPPTEQSLALLETAAHLAQIAIEQADADDMLHRHAVAFDNLHDGIVLTDAHGLITDWNPAAARMFGYSREEAIGTAVTRLHGSPTQRGHIAGQILDACTRDGRWRGELDFVRKDGASGVCESIVVPLRDAGGSLIGTVGVNRDVTDRKRAEAHLVTEAAVTRVLADARTRHEALPRLLEAVCTTCGWQTGSFWTIDPDRGLLHCEAWHTASPELAPFGDVTRAASFEIGVGLPGQVWAAARPVWITDVRAEPNFPRRAAATAAGLRGALGFPIVIAGRVLAVVEFYTHALRDPDRPLDAMLTVIGGQVGQFIERERLLTSEQDARAAAESANRAKDHFIAVLSHELRTPLSPVTTGARLLEDDPTLGPEQREIAATIRRNAELEARLIDDLLDVTRISRGKISLHRAPADVHELIRSVCQMVCSDATDRGLTLVVEPDAAHHHARADAARFQQVLWNLVKNALKFTPPGGRVTVRTHNPAPDRLELIVRDTGRGIDPAVLPHIFNAFEQGGADVTHRFGGLGLGLAISRGLVHLHDGALTAHSEGHGAGATFVVALPTCAPAPPPIPPRRKKPRTPIHREVAATIARRLLLVEDHADTARIMARLLGNDGYDVVVAHDIGSALRAANDQQFDLIISDLGLPDGSGLDLMRQLLARHGTRGIALTGYGRDEDVRKSAEAGFAAHLTKPVDVQKLKHLLRQLSS